MRYCSIRGQEGNENLRQNFEVVLLRCRGRKLQEVRLYLDAPDMGVLREQGLGIAFDGVVWHVRDSKGHPRFILICVVGRWLQPPLFFLRPLRLPR
jgi:hypothetical protein